ncbi:hypothetical protein SISNIDRAFT_518961 [Sistotremastrum niveocremeum HHB9708]|uniref:Uncharacterized protein n=1 Tax=Sistotremastrum niveocremeum HHB9708 TaxID=1314777 RepID=A0A164RQQ6_9AGAM|nr:hypothetical protein SISNIDRAFT_518961 [Sistotremastrum niveocremeum HHB9708]
MALNLGDIIDEEAGDADDSQLFTESPVDEGNSTEENEHGGDDAALERSADISDIQEISDLSIHIDEAQQVFLEQSLEMMAPYLISLHRVAALAKGRNGGVQRTEDWYSTTELRTSLVRAPNESFEAWWDRWSLLLSDAICTHYGCAPFASFRATDVDRIEKFIINSRFKGATFGWHILLTSWKSCMRTLATRPQWTHLDMDWRGALKTGYTRLRGVEPVTSVSFNVVADPVDLESGPDPGTFFDKILEEAPNPRSLSLELLDTHIFELLAFLEEFTSEPPGLRLGIRPEHEDDGENTIFFLSGFCRISFLALKGFDVTGLSRSLPVDACSSLRTLYIQPEIETSIDLSEILLILQECKMLKVLELASTEEITYKPNANVEEDSIAETFHTDLLRLCISTIANPLLDILFRRVKFRFLDETEFIVASPLCDGEREPLRLPSALRMWTDEASTLAVNLRPDSGKEEGSRITIDYSAAIEGHQRKHILHGLFTHGTTRKLMSPGKPRRSRPASGRPPAFSQVTGQPWPEDLILDFGSAFSNVTRLELDGVLPLQNQLEQLFEQLHLLSYLSVCGTSVMNVASALRSQTNMCPMLQILKLRHTFDFGEEDEDYAALKKALVAEASKFVTSRKGVSESPFEYLAIRHWSEEVVVFYKDEATPAPGDDVLATLFQTAAMEEEYDNITHRYFNAARRWSLEDMAQNMMYTAVET